MSCLEYFVIIGVVIAARVERERSVASALEIAGTLVQRSGLKNKINQSIRTPEDGMWLPKWRRN